MSHNFASETNKQNHDKSLRVKDCIVRIAPCDDQIRLDRWFHRHYPKIPFTLIAKLIRKGEIRLDGNRVKISTHVNSGQQLAIPTKIASGIIARETSEQNKNCNSVRKQPSKRQLEDLAQKIQQQILFQNDDLIIINKPQGIATQGGTNINISIDAINDRILRNSMGHEVYESCHSYHDSSNPLEVGVGHQNAKLKIVHRLDRETSGALILARSSSSAAKISQAIRDGLFKKRYLAILCGIPQSKMDIINFEISQKSDHYGKIEKKSAMTKYKVLDSANGVCLVEFEPMTGRTHQLRIHSAVLGCPILGDRKYNILTERLSIVSKSMASANGKSKSRHFASHTKRQCQSQKEMDSQIFSLTKSSHSLHLHAWKIKLTVNDITIAVDAPIPEYFYKTAKKFGLDTLLRL